MALMLLVALAFGMVVEAALATRGWGLGAALKRIRGE